MWTAGRAKARRAGVTAAAFHLTGLTRLEDVHKPPTVPDAAGRSAKIVLFFLHCRNSERKAVRVWRRQAPVSGPVAANTSAAVTLREWLWRPAHSSSSGWTS